MLAMGMRLVLLQKDIADGFREKDAWIGVTIGFIEKKSLRLPSAPRLEPCVSCWSHDISNALEVCGW